VIAIIVKRTRVGRSGYVEAEEYPMRRNIIGDSLLILYEWVIWWLITISK